MTIAVDFDGTIVENRYPEIGDERMFATETLKMLIQDRHRLILWTCREGRLLDDAINWCKERGVEFWTINKDFPEENVTKNQQFSRKIKADLFIDDRMVGGLPDWGTIYHMIKENKTLEQVVQESFGKVYENEIEEIAQKTVSINTQIEQIRAGSKAYEEEALRKDGEASVLQTTLNHNNETIERLKNDIGDVDNTNLSIDAQIEEKNEFIAKSEKDIELKKQELKEVTDEMNNLLSSNEEFSKLTVELNQKITALTLKLSDCRVKCSQALTSAEQIKSRQSVVDDSIAQGKKDLEEIEAKKSESEEKLNALQSRIDENNNSMQGYKIKLQTKTDKADKLKAELEKANAEFNQKQQKARMLLDLEKNMEGFSGAVKAVMKQAQSKALSGVHGPLSSLITVDNEYSVAVEVALGAAMQNIVVGNEADAKRAIYYLKNNRVGRATFLPISAIKARNLDEHGLDDNLGFVAIASDLVECKAEYKNIISNLLGRVVIVEDMDCAIGIAKRYSNRFKIVTVDGQVINPGGSMTGGSQSRGAGILSRGNMIDELNAQAKELEKACEDIKTKYKTALEEANFALAELQGAEADLQQAKEEFIRAQGEHKLVSEKYDLLSSQLNILVNEKNNSKSRIEEFEKEAKSGEEKIKEIENEIKLNETELEKTSGNASEINAKRDEFRAKSEQINLELVTLAKDNESAKLSVEELNFRKNSQFDRVKTIQDEIAQIEDKNKSLLISINEIKAQANDLRVKAEQSNNDVSEQINQRNELEKRTTELRSEEKVKNQDREKLSGSIVRLDERKLAMKKEYDELNDMLFEQYELTKHEAEALNIQIDDMSEAKRRLHEIKVAIKGLGSINVGAIEEYKEVSERYTFLKEQIGDVEKSKNELLKIIEDLTASMSEKFLSQFNKINEEFKVCFADFFGGGKGELVLEEPDNCLESPIEIRIQPPGKSVQNINLFSGGEKSLAAMALLFSVLKVQPAPFCIYDEVEAALDDVNVERFAKYMRKMTDKTQFISITHRRGTMEEADVLYGVTMQEKGVSKLIELQTAELAAKMGLE